jgi:hypothetical protein
MKATSRIASKQSSKTQSPSDSSVEQSASMRDVDEIFESSPAINIPRKVKPSASSVATPGSLQEKQRHTSFDHNIKLPMNACSCKPLAPERMVTLPPMNLDSEGEHYSTDLNRSRRDLHPLLLGTDRFVQENHVATLLPHSIHRNIVIADDEISDKTDTFAPFHTNESDKDNTSFIDQITFEGDDNLQRRCKALCNKYKHIFKDSLKFKTSLHSSFRLISRRCNMEDHI